MTAPNVLIIENDPGFADALLEVFSRAGAVVETAPDGETGIARAEAKTPDLVVLSVELPGISGYSVCKNLKRSQLSGTIPVFLLSSTATEEIFAQHRRMQTRADEYFMKPVDPIEVVAAAERYVDLSAQATRDHATLLLSGDDFGDIFAPEAAASASAASPASSGLFDDVESPLDGGNPDGGGARTGRAEVATAQQPVLPSISDSGPRPVTSTAATASSEGSAHDNARRLAQDDVALREATARISALETELAAAVAEALNANTRVVELTNEAQRAVPEPPAASARDLLTLREALNAKEREVLELKDELFKRDHTIIEANEARDAAARRSKTIEDDAAEVRRRLVETEAARVALEADAADARARLETQAANAREHVARIDELEDQLSAALGDVSRRADELAQAQEGHSALSARVSEQEALLETLRQDLQAAQAACAEAVGACEAADAAREAAEAQRVEVDGKLRIAESRLAEAEADKAAAELRATEAEAEKTAAELRAEAAEAERAAAELRITEAEAEKTAAELRAEAAEAEKAAAELRITEAEAEKTAAEQRAEAAEAEKTAAELRITEAEAEKTAAEQRAEAAEAEKATAELRATEAAEEKAAAELRATEAEGEKSVAAQRAEEAEAEKAAAELRAAEAESDRSAMAARATEAEEAATAAAETAERAQATVAAAEEQISALRFENNDLASESARLALRLESVRDSLRASEAARAADGETLRQLAATLERASQQHRLYVEQSGRRFQTADRAIEALAADIRALSVHLRELREAIADREGRLIAVAGAIGLNEIALKDGLGFAAPTAPEPTSGPALRAYSETPEPAAPDIAPPELVAAVQATASFAMPEDELADSDVGASAGAAAADIESDSEAHADSDLDTDADADVDVDAGSDVDADVDVDPDIDIDVDEAESSGFSSYRDDGEAAVDEDAHDEIDLTDDAGLDDLEIEVSDDDIAVESDDDPSPDDGVQPLAAGEPDFDDALSDPDGESDDTVSTAEAPVSPSLGDDSDGTGGPEASPDAAPPAEDFELIDVEGVVVLDDLTDLEVLDSASIDIDEGMIDEDDFV